MSVYYLPFFVIILGILLYLYIKTRAKIRSIRKFEHSAAKKQAANKSDEMVFTCEFCGALIHPEKNAACPKCGASYAENIRWKEIQETDRQKVLNRPEEFVDSVGGKNLKGMVRRSRILLVLMAMILIGSIVICLEEMYFFQVVSGTNYLHDERLNHMGEHYQKEVCSLENDGILLDEDGVFVQVTGIYRDADKVKIEYLVNNTNESDMHLRFNRYGQNGKAQISRTPVVNHDLKKGRSVTVYEELDEKNPIWSLAYGTFHLDQMNYFHEQNATIVLTTGLQDGKDSVQGEPVMENDHIKVVKNKETLLIINQSDEGYQMNLGKVKSGNDEYTVRSWDIIIPQGYSYCLDQVTCKQLPKNKENLKLTLYFQSLENASEKFTETVDISNQIIKQ